VPCAQIRYRAYPTVVLASRLGLNMGCSEQVSNHHVIAVCLWCTSIREDLKLASRAFRLLSD
jgi:hypothetical protein